MIDLHVYPWAAWDVYRDAFRTAKQQSAKLASYQLKPVEGRPGCGRVLAFGGPPPFAADYVTIVRAPEKLELGVVEHLLAWYVGLEDEPRASGVADWLSFTMGRVATEIG